MDVESPSPPSPSPTGGGEGVGGETPLAQLRDAMWEYLDFLYEPDAPFSRFAREHALGGPLTDTIQIGVYVCQGFAGGIVYGRADEVVGVLGW